MRFNTVVRLLTVATASRSITAASFCCPGRISIKAPFGRSRRPPPLCRSSGWVRDGGADATAVRGTMTRRFLSSGLNEPVLQNIGWEEMDSILDEYEELGREQSGMIVMDVRNEDEVAYTGKLSPNTKTLPLPAIMQYNVFAMDEDEFEETCGFAKPALDETLVFSCAAGIRSVHAAKFAANAGYSKLINYTGGANEWFTR
jgi:rhodanese-related sulfurtransferase